MALLLLPLPVLVIQLSSRIPALSPSSFALAAARLLHRNLPLAEIFFRGFSSSNLSTPSPGAADVAITSSDVPKTQKILIFLASIWAMFEALVNLVSAEMAQGLALRFLLLLLFVVSVLLILVGIDASPIGTFHKDREA